MLDDTNLALYQKDAQALWKRYGWCAVTPNQLVERLRLTLTADGTEAERSRQIMQCYSLMLYEICKQTADLAQRELGFTDLFHYLHHYALARRYDDAEELAQRALVLVYAQLDSCRFPVAFLEFAHLKLLQVRRDRQRQLGREELFVALPEPAELLERGPAQPAIEDTLIRQEGLLALLAALRRLPERQRQAVVLKFFRGWSDKEIAAQLGISVNYVRVSRCNAIGLLSNDPDLQAYFAGDDRPPV